METGELAAYAYPLLMLPVLERLDGRIFVSRALQEKAAAYFQGETRVIPNGIDYHAFAAPDIQPIPEFEDGRPNILFVGRMDARKGFRHLLRAYPRIKQCFPQARLLVVGAYGPDETKSYRRYARRYGLEDIYFIGKVSADDLRRYYRTATVFAAPSTGSESFGIILLEAMAAGAPVVASDIAGYRSVLTHDQEGWLVEPGSPGSIAQAIIRLLEDPAVRQRMAAAGQQTARQYDWGVVAPQVLDYYRELLESRPSQKRKPRSQGLTMKFDLNPSIKIHIDLNPSRPSHKSGARRLNPRS
jgi:phosphatidylinositol alpha-mannosyltransferase